MFIKECIITKYGNSCISNQLKLNIIKKEYIIGYFIIKCGEILLQNFIENYKFINLNNFSNIEYLSNPLDF